ncbi:hypothetical protein ACIBD9_08100 [Micromonospora sp. NPDC050784]|uniref:hypothetical protein n=1 Tax=Micromonospora sp. NPDC050784 TaxID=3364281 RepID=UPI0037A95D4F
MTWHSWWIERDGDRALLPSVLTGWDYASDVTVGISASVDASAALASSGLESIEDIEILILGDCPDTQQRIVATADLATCSDGCPVDIRLHLPPGQLAGHVQLSAHLVLVRDAEGRTDRVAYQRGSRLHSSDRFVVQLEGATRRFPTESVAFSEVRLARAPWTVLTINEDLSGAFMGSVRLLINTEHPVGQLILATPPDPRIERLIKADVIRLLVARAAQHALEGPAGHEYEEGSVGQVLHTMCRLYLGRSLRSAARLYVDDPAEFDVLLHDRLEPLTGIVA